jgi:hypothetical protein
MSHVQDNYSAPASIAPGSSIDQTAAAAGDKIGAKLATAIRDSKGQALASKRTAVTAAHR